MTVNDSRLSLSVVGNEALCVGVVSDDGRAFFPPVILLQTGASTKASSTAKASDPVSGSVVASPAEGVLKALGCAHLCAAFKRVDVNSLGSHLLSTFQLRSPCYHVYLITVSPCRSTSIFKSSPQSVLSSFHLLDPSLVKNDSARQSLSTERL